MRQLAIVLLFAAASCAENHSESVGKTGPDQAMVRPDQVVWKDGPPSLPPGAKVAVLEGDPTQPGFFAMRLKFPDGYKVMPHTHPKVERVTIIQGTLHLGMGGTFDKSATHALTAGSYSFMPPGMKHFAWTEGETILQLATIGPWVINYINPADDPRKK